MNTFSLTIRERLLIEQQCRDLVLTAARLTDSGDHKRFAQLFVANAILRRPNGSVLTGRESILKSYQERPDDRMTCHLIVSTLLTSCRASFASATSQVLLWSGRKSDIRGTYGQPADRQIVGVFNDEFEKTDDGWQFSARKAEFLLYSEHA